MKTTAKSIPPETERIGTIPVSKALALENSYLSKRRELQQVTRSLSVVCLRQKSRDTTCETLAPKRCIEFHFGTDTTCSWKKVSSVFVW